MHEACDVARADAGTLIQPLERGAEGREDGFTHPRRPRCDSLAHVLASLAAHPAPFWFAAVAAVLLIGVAKAGFGGGAGVIATPLLSLTVPVAEAAALLLPILLVADALTVYHYRKEVSVPHLRASLPSALVGIVAGSLMFAFFRDNERVLEIGVGVIALAFVLYQALRARLVRALEGRTPSMLWGVPLGALSGFTSTLAHVGGPPFVIFLLPHRLSRRLFVGTNGVFFFVVNLVKLVPYALLALLTIGNLSTTLVLLPLAYLGVRLGRFLNARVSERAFAGIVYLLLTLTGVQLLLGGNLLELLFGG